MRAARFRGNQRIEIIDVPRPEPGPGEVLVEVAYCGLCGSERLPHRRGTDLTPGHEVSGAVVAANGCDVAEGTRAAVYLSMFCGECRYCKEGTTNLCRRSRGLLGWTPPLHGGYADYVVVPARNLLPLHPDVDLQAAVLLLDTFGTAWHALRLVHAEEATRALVIGCGPLGLGVLAGLQSLGVRETYASDFVASRLAAAEEFGAAPVRPEEVPALEDLDLIVEVAGQPAALTQAVNVIAPRGTVVMLGEPREDWPFHPCPTSMLKDYSLVRSWYFPVSEFAENQQPLLDGKVTAAQFVSHVLPLDRLDEAFRLFVSGETRKVLVAVG